MDVKKSPKASLEDKKLLFVLLGLVMVLSLIFIAFEWTDREVTVYEVADTSLQSEEEIEIIQTAPELPPPPPPPAPEVVEIINVVEDNIKVDAIKIETEEDNKKIVIAAPVAGPTIVEEDDNVVFQVVEKMPSFPGGDAALFKFLGDNVKYPVIAQENGVQGRVICQFVVNRDGSLT